MNVELEIRQKVYKIMVWSEDEQAYVYSHDEIKTYPYAKRAVDPNEIIDIEGEDITLEPTQLTA